MPWKISRKIIEIAPRPKATGTPGQQHQQRDDKNDDAFVVELTGASQRFARLLLRDFLARPFPKCRTAASGG